MTDTDGDGINAYRARAKAWLAANVPLRVIGQGLRSVDGISAADVAAARAKQREQYDAGYVGIDVPVEYGGQGLTALHERIWLEESGRYALPSPGGIASHVTLGIVLPTILAYAAEGQKRAWVPKILRGEEIWAQLLSEPGAGSDLAGVLTQATRDGDRWVLTGTKVWSSGAMAADFGICLARTDWEVPKHQGLTWFKVPLNDERVTVRPIREINGSEEFCEEFLDEVSVDEDMVIGPVNGGWPIANAMLTFERSGGATMRSRGMPGQGGRQLPPDLVALTTERGLAQDPATRQIIAKVHINDFMQSELAGRVAEKIRTGGATPAWASLIKLGVGLLDPLRASAGMEIAGENGIAWRADRAQAAAPAVNFLNGRIYSIAGGSNQIQRNIIGERVLGLPREPSADSERPFRQVLRDAKTWGTKK